MLCLAFFDLRLQIIGFNVLIWNLILRGGLIMKKIIYYGITLMIVAIISTACAFSSNSSGLVAATTDTQVSSPIAEQVLTLPFFVESVSMIVTSFTEGEVQLCIVNDSEYGFFFWGNIPYWFYQEDENIKLDYFDGENWRNILHASIRVDDLPDTVDPPERILVAPLNSVIVEHSLAHYPLPEFNQNLFRIRKHIYMDSRYFPLGLLQILRESYEAGTNTWLKLPGQPRHTLIAEFYWDGRVFYPR